MKVCIDCGKEEVVERKRCKECAKIYNRERVKKYYNKNTKKRYGIGVCSICGESMMLNKPNQLTHSKCRRKTVENYNKVSRSNKGNTLARQIIIDLGFIISRDIVIHHIDENPENNVLSNFMIISLRKHSSLHRFLQQQWSLYRKLYSSNAENCWNSLRDQLTKEWLEMTNSNVIKITDIGQSAAEPLNKDAIYIFA
jgi:hypothetical protein